MYCTKSFRIISVAGCKVEEGRERYDNSDDHFHGLIFLVVDCLYVTVLNV
jgi:hypothetical protein